MDWTGGGSIAGPAVGTAIGFAGTALGELLAVASGFLACVSSSGEAAGSVVAPVAVGTAFGFAGAEVVGTFAAVSGSLAGVRSSGENAGSVVAVAPCLPVGLGVAVDPGGHVIQHSAPAGNDRNVNPVPTNSPVSKRDFAFMILPLRFDFYSRPFSERVREANTIRRAPLRVRLRCNFISFFWRDGGS